MSSSIDTPQIRDAQKDAVAENQFRFVQRVVMDHWVLLASATVIGAALAALLFFLQMESTLPRYQSRADLFIKQPGWQEGLFRSSGRGPLFPMDAESLVNQAAGAEFYREVARAQVQMDLTARGATSGIASQEEINAKANELRGKITLVPIKDRQRIEIQVAQCETPAEAEQLGDLAARVFIELVQQIRLDEGGEQHTAILAKLEELRQQLFEAVTREWDFKEAMGFRNYGSVDDDMAKMFDELDELKVTREETESKLQELEAKLEQNAADLPDAMNNVTKGVVDKLFEELDGLLQRKLNMSAEFQPEYPPLQELEYEIEEKQKTILEAIAKMESGAGGSGAWARRQQIYSQQMDLRLATTANEIRSRSLERMLQEMIPEIPELANRNLEYEQLTQETESIRGQFNSVQQQERDLRTAMRHGSGQIERADSVKRASLMPIDSGPKSIWVNTLIGALVGFIAVFVFAMMLEVNDTSIRSIEDVHTYIGLDVIGTIPKMRFGKPRGGRRRRATYVSTANEEEIDACIVTQHDPKSPISEAYRTLRTNFQFATLASKAKSVMVTSAVPGEGKTTTAVNLAVTMADRGMRVLIVDTDLRRPQVHRVLRMERGPGLSDILRYGVDYKSVIRKTRVDRLSIISSGRVPPNPSELIGSHSMESLMARLGDEFDLVICDAPSVLVVTDPVLLATQVDTAIMVVSTNNARRETVVRANELLATANVNVAGVVVNGLETTRRHYYYYYYYYDDGTANRRKWYHFF
ncbi:MAG: polysaccharide biosynthesis tyrosine autokinase [Candidatus Hydrogenedens sp.]|nr:polysaccharide biosynthesis tyrosine autokinase [Candidatus Hydrogenedens sp.]